MTETRLPDANLGVAAKDALIGWRQWVHRRVESIHLMPGERGSRRVSLDCTPPPDPRLAYIESDRLASTIGKVDGPVHVPMALVKKAAMRDLDVVDAEGRPMPVLGRREDGDFALAALLALYGTVFDPPLSLVSTLEHIVRSDEPTAAKSAEVLLGTGACVDGIVVDMESVPEVVALWTRDLAASFLLIGLLPADRAGTRQVLKWSANWHIEPGAMKGGRRLAVAVGTDVAEIALPVSGAALAASYHLEVHLPPELASARLELPPLLGSAEPACVDDSGNPVAHVHAEYEEVPEKQDAIVHVAVPWAGLRMTATLSAAFTTVALVLSVLLPGASHALRSSASGAAALLLVAPALMIAFGSRSRESVAVSHVLAPLRAVTAGCAVLLVTVAASIVGGLAQPWYDLLWWSGALVAGAVTYVLVTSPRGLSDLRARLRRVKIWE